MAAVSDLAEQDPMPPLGLAVIGCGGITRSAHLPAIAALGDRLRLVATVDIDLAAAARAAAPFGARAFADADAAIDDPSVEAVLIATPEDSHAALTLAAVAAGKHVLCEKPIAPTLEEADRMIAGAEAAGVVFMVAHSRRFTRRYMEVERLLRAGRIGRLRLVRENERRPRGFGPGGERSFRPDHWTGDPARCAGIALLAGIHEADVLCWLAGQTPLAVQAHHAVTTPGNAGVPDFLSFTLRFPDGAIGASEIARMLPPGYPTVHQLELYGTGGTLHARDSDGAGLVRHDAGGARQPRSIALNLSGGRTYARQLASFVAAIRQGVTPPVTARAARLALAVALATIEAAESGRSVAIDPAVMP